MAKGATLWARVLYQFDAELDAELSASAGQIVQMHAPAVAPTPASSAARPCSYAASCVTAARIAASCSRLAPHSAAAMLSCANMARRNKLDGLKTNNVAVTTSVGPSNLDLGLGSARSVRLPPSSRSGLALRKCN